MSEMHLLLFTGDNIADLSRYASALENKYTLKVCGCPVTSRIMIREARGHVLDAIVIMWKHIDADDASKIANEARKAFQGIPIVVIAHPKINAADINEIHPSAIIFEKEKDAHLNDLSVALSDLVHAPSKREASHRHPPQESGKRPSVSFHELAMA